MAFREGGGKEDRGGLSNGRKKKRTRREGKGDCGKGHESKTQRFFWKAKDRKKNSESSKEKERNCKGVTVEKEKKKGVEKRKRGDKEHLLKESWRGGQASEKRGGKKKFTLRPWKSKALCLKDRNKGTLKNSFSQETYS